MLAVGKDTYITIEQMNEYVERYCPSTDPLRIQWEAMNEADRETYLRNAFNTINMLPFTGSPIKMPPVQTLPFPRSPWNTSTDWALVHAAQATIALDLTDIIANSEAAQRRTLQRAGVQSYSIGDLSEKFADGAAVKSASNLFGLSENAYIYLSKWLSGGYNIRGPRKGGHRVCPTPTNR